MFVKKHSCRGFHPEKKILHRQWPEKNFLQTEPPPPITFLMVRPLTVCDAVMHIWKLAYTSAIGYL